jgi:formylglycine-generating enzyme required for sulfatase activity
MRTAITALAGVVVFLGGLAGALADVFNMPSGQTSLQFVTVGNPGNAPDYRFGPSFGAVDQPYQIGKYEVTAGQYTAFLNAVAANDTYGLYRTEMADPIVVWGCNIQVSGSPGSYTYSVASDWANRPVNCVSFWSAARFANWLHNGQPTGPQNASTTEDGAYTLNGYIGSEGGTIAKNAGARYWIPSEDEWHKAAYYDPNKLGPGVPGYWLYPTMSDTPPINTLIDPDPGNHANFYDEYGTGTGNYSIGSPYYKTPVGAFAHSGSAYGTFDQGGNLWEWTDTVGITFSGWSSRVVRGGCFAQFSENLAASSFHLRGLNAGGGGTYFGFRVASVPEPSGIALLAAGAIVLLAYLWRRRRRAG